METPADNPYLQKIDGAWHITKAGQDYLEGVVTSWEGPVYAFNHHIPPVIVAAAMARLSRRAGDMRLTVLDEFALAGDEDANALIHRVVTAYGDDSVQQLTGLHLVVEGASNLLTKQLERGRFLGALEQSTRYIFYDTKGADGRYLYYTPDHLPAELLAAYQQTMDAIFDGYSSIVRQLADYIRQKHPQGEENRTAWMQATRAQACDAARQLLPVATKSTVGLFGSAQAIEAMIMRLLSEDLPEARQTGQSILEQCRQIIPAFLERADKPERGGATSAHRATRQHQLKELANEMLVPVKPRRVDSVELVDYWPRDEFDLVAEMLYEQSTLSIRQIRQQLQHQTKRQLIKVMKAAVGERLNRRHKPGRAFEKAHIEWDIVCDYGIFRDLQRHRVLDAIEWQRLTIDYGYAEVPAIVKEAGLESEYRQICRQAEALYRRMMDEGFQAEAQYATLLGHRMRFRLVMNLREAFHLIELRTSPQGHPGYRLICQRMYRQLKDVYPNLAKAMVFVNQGEDEALTRLAAERASAFKRQQLGIDDEPVTE